MNRTLQSFAVLAIASVLGAGCSKTPGRTDTAATTTTVADKRQQGVKFAHCIRDNGVKDFPDPVNGEPLVDTYKIPSANRPGGMDILNAAMAKCGDLVGRAIGRR